MLRRYLVDRKSKRNENTGLLITLCSQTGFRTGKLGKSFQFFEILHNFVSRGGGIVFLSCTFL